MSSSLQFRLAKYQALFAKYDFLNYTKFEEFANSLPQHDCSCFQALIEEGKLIARTTLYSVVNVANTFSQAIATAIVMRRESWLCASGFPRKVQNTIKDLPFNEFPHLNQKMESLCTLKDSRTAL